jgi:hypothetical protein
MKTANATQPTKTATKKTNTKKATTKATAKVATPKPKQEAKPKKKSMAQVSREILTPLLEKGKHTQAELKAMLLKAGVTTTTADVILTDSKNPKYNKFPKLVIKGDDGKLSFKK